ncbi:MAG: type I-E CRISPR-associated protein Cas5/CasD [Acidobacteria bacterium]|nr:type I-E CRISPR-associated protein Cas5/CasD [Acidobacteriota bacterium]
MAEFVIFTLAAPMGAFADLAGHERRHSGTWPARSALLGLVGAALGVRRDETARQQSLWRWRTAVSVLSRGVAYRDFHTVQTVPTARIKRPATRRDALEALESKDNPVITWRDYRSDCAFGVALWGGEDPEEVRNALIRPHFTLYLGRKSCPLSAPAAPKVIQAANPVEALARVHLPPFLEDLLDPKSPLMVVSEQPIDGGRREIRWDQPLDRVSWHFGPRWVHVAGLRESGTHR